MSITPPVTGTFDGSDLLPLNALPALSHAWRKLIDDLAAIRKLEAIGTGKADSGT